MSVAELVVALIAAVGVGTIAGAWIQGRTASSNLSKQLAQDLETRKLEHRHELDLRQLEDQQRLREQRLTRLREGFLFLVQALLQLEEVLDAMKEPTEVLKGDIPRWRQLLLEANRKADQARAGLLLERAGEPAIRRYVTLGKMLQLHWMLLGDVDHLRQASSPDLPSLVRDVGESSAKITKMIVDQIRLAQEALAELEAPLDLTDSE